MSQHALIDVQRSLGSGLLSFPVTHFDDDLEFDEPAYRENLRWLADHAVAGLFAAGGTGEFFSLQPHEVARVVRAAVEEVGGRTLVFGAAGYGTTTAIAMAEDAERVGADGILLMPPYLTEPNQQGLIDHVRRVCRSTQLGVILYHRANAVYSARTVELLADEFPNLIGIKDGIGDIELLAAVRARLGDRLVSIGGLPTAETYAMPYLELGVTTYSSALFNFVPAFALEFYAAVKNRDRDAVYRMIREFILPYLEIRNGNPGYAVSIVKAGMRVVGRDAGPVRPPLSDLNDEETERLATLVRYVGGAA